MWAIMADVNKFSVERKQMAIKTRNILVLIRFLQFNFRNWVFKVILIK